MHASNLSPMLRTVVRSMYLTWFSWCATLQNIFNMIEIKYVRKCIFYFLPFEIFLTNPLRIPLLSQVTWVGFLWWEKSFSHGNNTKCISLFDPIFFDNLLTWSLWLVIQAEWCPRYVYACSRPATEFFIIVFYL